MLKAVLISGLAAFLSSVVLGLAMWRRPREVDDWGSPCMRFFGPRFSMPIVGLLVLAVGLYELNDPTNYRYSGNLLILAYTPITIALAIFAASVFYGTFRISLRPDAIETLGWPLRPRRFPLQEFRAVEERGNNIVLTFSDGRELKLSGLLSGRAYFVERLMALTGGSNGPASLRSAGG